MEKIEVNVRGTEYSAYFETESDFTKEKKQDVLNATAPQNMHR